MSAPVTTASGEALGRLARDDIPFLFDALSVGADGTVIHTPREALRFAFDYGGVSFNAVGRRNADSFRLTIEADLGPLPYSVESVQARLSIQDLIAASGSLIEPRFSIGADQTIRVETTVELLNPVSPVLTLTLVTEVLLVLKPWLERLGTLLKAAARRTSAPPAQLN